MSSYLSTQRQHHHLQEALRDAPARSQCPVHAHNPCLASQSSSKFTVIPSFLQFYFVVCFHQKIPSLGLASSAMQTMGPRPSLGGCPRSCGVRSSSPGPAHSSPRCDNRGAMRGQRPLAQGEASACVQVSSLPALASGVGCSHLPSGLHLGESTDPQPGPSWLAGPECGAGGD